MTKLHEGLLILLSTTGFAFVTFADDVTDIHDIDVPTSIDVLQDIKADFELLDHQGNTVTDEYFHGRYVLLTFGFTHCPHICPMIAANMGMALKASAKNATGIFVSVDTERDTPAITHEYARKFHHDMIGLSGSYEQVSRTAKNFKVSYAITKTQSSYTVQHTSSIYLLDPEGKLINIFAQNTPPATISAAMN